MFTEKCRINPELCNHNLQHNHSCPIHNKDQGIIKGKQFSDTEATIKDTQKNTSMTLWVSFKVCSQMVMEAARTERSKELNEIDEIDFITSHFIISHVASSNNMGC